MAETIMIPNTAANKAFDDIGMINPNNEIPEIPGFHDADTDYNKRDAKSGRIPAFFIIKRIEDGKKFAATYTEPADDNFFAESPFYPKTEGETEFREVIQKTRTIIEEYYEYAE